MLNYNNKIAIRLTPKIMKLKQRFREKREKQFELQQEYKKIDQNIVMENTIIPSIYSQTIQMPSTLNNSSIEKSLSELKISQTSDIITLFKETVEEKYNAKQKRDIWEHSEWKHIAELENDDVGKVGETFIQRLCDESRIEAEIDGCKTKKRGGGYGDGTIKGKTCEIKTARGGTGQKMSFQHELGEKPWLADYMIFVDVAPEKIYITIFPNFTEEQYKAKIKCEPYFPTRSFCWRKNSGCFKLDTSEDLNEFAGVKVDGNTFIWNTSKTIDDISMFINRIIE